MRTKQIFSTFEDHLNQIPLIFKSYILDNSEGNKLLETLAPKAGLDSFEVNETELLVDGYEVNDTTIFHVISPLKVNAKGRYDRRSLRVSADFFLNHNQEFELKYNVGNLGILTLLLGIGVLIVFEILVGFIGIPSFVIVLFVWSALRFAKKDYLELKSAIDYVGLEEETS